MSIAYTKWSADEDKKRGLLPDGLYEARIDSIQDSLTQGGKFDKKNQPIPQMKMLVIDFVIDFEGRERKTKGWIMLEGDMSWQFRHLCQACGLLEKYENDSIELRELIGKKPVLDIRTKLQRDKNNNEVTRNVINDYLVPSNLKPSSLTPIKDNFINDAIPY